MVNHTCKISMKSAFVVSLVLCMVLVVQGRPVCAAEPIKIGVVACLSGPMAFVGQPMKEAITAIFDDLNKKGGVLGRQVEVLVENDSGNTANAVIAATKLIRDENVSLIIGASAADAGAIVPLVEREQVPMLAANPLVVPFRKHVFLLGPGDERGAAHIMEFVIKKLGAKKIGILRDTGKFGTQGSKYYRQEIAKYPDSSIIIEESMDVTDTNVIPQLTKIKAAKPDILIIHSTSNGPIPKAYKQLGMTVPVYGSHAMPSPEFLKQGGAIAEENRWIMCASKSLFAEELPANDPFRKNVYEPFKKALQAKYGPDKGIHVFHAASGDAAMVTIEALRIAGTDNRAALRDALEKVRYDGFLGEFACSPTDHQGSPRDTMPEMVVKDGKFVPYAK
jgi:branched-chain amino acid transport system substrate-binding protein